MTRVMYTWCNLIQNNLARGQCEHFNPKHTVAPALLSSRNVLNVGRIVFLSK